MGAREANEEGGRAREREEGGSAKDEGGRARERRMLWSALAPASSSYWSERSPPKGAVVVSPPQSSSTSQRRYQPVDPPYLGYLHGSGIYYPDQDGYPDPYAEPDRGGGYRHRHGDVGHGGAIRAALERVEGWARTVRTAGGEARRDREREEGDVPPAVETRSSEERDGEDYDVQIT